MAAAPELPTPETYPVLPLRERVVFPRQTVSLFAGRPKSLHALEDAFNNRKPVVLVTQRDAQEQDPAPTGLYGTGTLARVTQLARMPDGAVKALFDAVRRVKIVACVAGARNLEATIEIVPESAAVTNETAALMRTLRERFEEFARNNRQQQPVNPEQVQTITAPEHPGTLADSIGAALRLKIAEEQELLEIYGPAERLNRVLEWTEREIDIANLEKSIRGRVKRNMERSQREYYLNEQLQAIQRELGGSDKDPARGEAAEIEDKLAQKNLPPEVRAKAEKELAKLKMMSPMAAESAVVRNYLDWILNLPWLESSPESQDIAGAERILEEDHYGLHKVKDRIVEHLAVQALVQKLRGPIMCFVGPPGVGKTSLAKSIARATGRKFVRISLGGVRDEAEIRGHRRTYIGSLPGKIIQNLKRAGTNNPVMLLDEIDKMTTDFRGDPASALLEALDPEQNNAFNDHYLDLDFDLSRVMFLTTANTLPGIPSALRDRLETIRIAGYTDVEKRFIARRHLIKKQLQANGLESVNVKFSREAIDTIIHRYTREAGVRALERHIASIARKIARRHAKAPAGKDYAVGRKRVFKLLGVPAYGTGKEAVRDGIGLVNGLAWTEFGGEILAIEVNVMPGTGKLILTGKLGDVMQESAQAALTYIRGRCEALGIDPELFSKRDLHIHIPEGATPKDGPSAGIAMAAAMASALTGRLAYGHIAMTGEITLRGRVLTIGGLKEKILAAHRYGIRVVLIPEENQKDLKEIPRGIRAQIEIVPVRTAGEVLDRVLMPREAPAEEPHAAPPSSPGEPLPAIAPPPDPVTQSVV